MALFDINTLIAKRGITPKLNSQSMFKQITFDDQWIGYDDADTVALKKSWGNDYCFGGTMQVSDRAVHAYKSLAYADCIFKVDT